MNELLDPQQEAQPVQDPAEAYVAKLVAQRQQGAAAYVQSLVQKRAQEQPPSLGEEIGSGAGSFLKAAAEGTAGAVEGLYNLARPLAKGVTGAFGGDTSDEAWDTHNKAVPTFLRDLAGRIDTNPLVEARGGLTKFLAKTAPETAGGILPLMAGGESLPTTMLLGAAQADTGAREAGAASGADQGTQDANRYIQDLIGAASAFGPGGALTRKLGSLPGEALGGALLGTGQSLASQVAQKATIAPNAPIDVPGALEQGAALGVVGAGMHVGRSAIDTLTGSAPIELQQAPEPVPAGTLPEIGGEVSQPAAEAPPAEQLQVPQGTALQPATAPEAAPQQPDVPRGTAILESPAPVAARAADHLLKANGVQGQIVPGTGPEHTFAEEFAKQHGLDLVWVDAGKELELPGTYLDRGVALDVHGDPISLVFHEASHALAKDDPVAYGKMLAEIRTADPEGFQKHLGEYERDFQAAGVPGTEGRTLSDEMRTQEGAARLVERMSGYIQAAFTDTDRLQTLLENDPGIVRRIVDKAITLLQKAGINRWQTSQQKALISLRMFARDAGEARLKPNRAADLALKIRESFRAIEGRELPKPPAEEKAGPEVAQVTTPPQKQPPLEKPETIQPQGAPQAKEADWAGFDPNAPVEEQIRHPLIREHLLNLIPEMGHNQRGGELIRNDKGDVTGRTSWAPKSSWWSSRPTKMVASAMEKLVQRATSEKPGTFTENQRHILDFLIHTPGDYRREDQGAVDVARMHDEQFGKVPELKSHKLEDIMLSKRSKASDEAIAAREDEGGPKREVAGEEAPFSVKSKEDIDPLGFYSPLRRAMESERLPAKASGEDWLNIIRKAPGAKRDEIEWAGVEQFLEGKKSVTKQEVREYLRENEVKVEEIARGVAPNALDESREAGRPINESKASRGEPVFPGPSYRLPGGKNYRELLLTLPPSRTSSEGHAALKVAHADAVTQHLNAVESRRRLAVEMIRKLEDAGYSQLDRSNILLGRDTRASRAFEEGGSPEAGNVELRQLVHEYWNAADEESATFQARDRAKRAERGDGAGMFTQGHWSEPNVLAHMRTTDRVDVNGRKTLFLEEVQSDWHQKGRDYGYQGSPEEISRARGELHKAQAAAHDAMKRLGDLGFDSTSQALGQVYHDRADWKERFDVSDGKFAADAAAIDQWIKADEAFQRIASTKIPRAPFAQTWHELAMRRAVRYAAENGYDQVAWTRGAQQVARYEGAMRAAVDEIEVSPLKDSPGQVAVRASKRRERVWSGDLKVEGKTDLAQAQGVTLDDVIGSEMARQVRADPWNTHSFAGDDLAIGGKGMTSFYDGMLPAAANKIAKPWGLKVGEALIDAGKVKGQTLVADRVHSLEITPEMRASVLSKGQPRFAVKSREGEEGFDVPDDTRSAAFRRAIVNDLDRVSVLEKAAPGKVSGDSLEQVGQLFPGRTYGEGEKLRQQIWKPMKAVMRASKIEPFDSKPGEPSASDFLYGLAALKANETLANEHPEKFGTLLNPGSGMTSVDADRFVTEALKGPKAAAYKEIQRLNRALNAKRLEAWVSGGLISPEQRVSMLKKWGLDYVPFRTAQDPSVKLDDVPARPRGFNIAGKEFRAREGRSTKADSPLAFAFDSAERALDRKERNLFGLKLADWTKANDFGNFLRVETDANNIKEGEYKLSYKRNGEQQFLVTRDKALYAAFKRIAPEPGVIRAFDKALGFLHKTIIQWNPAFPFYNLPKDLGTASMKMGIEHGIDWSAAIVKNAPSAAKGAWNVLRDEKASGKWEDVYKHARDAGALIGWNQQFDPVSRLKDFENTVKRGSFKEGVAQLFDFVDDANRAVELGTRMATFEKALRSGKSETEAAVIARKVTADFAQKGTWTPIARRLFLFFGAGVQGTREASMAIAKNPARGTAALGALIGIGYAMASLSRIFADDDENGGSSYDRLSEWRRGHTGGVMVGKKLYGMPLPWFWNVPYYLGTQIEAMQHGDRLKREVAKDVVGNMVDAFSPIQGSSIAQMLTPTLLRPFEEIATNQDYAGNPIRPPQDPSDKTPLPMSEQAFKNVNPALQAAARALNRWTGGNPERAGAIDISPADMEHVISFVAGGLGSNAWRATEAARKLLSGEDTAPGDFPILRAYVASPGQSATATLFYRNVTRALTSEEEAKKGDEPGEAAVGDLAGLATRIMGSLAKLRKARDFARAQGEDPKDLEAAIRDLMASFNREVLRASRPSDTLAATGR